MAKRKGKPDAIDIYVGQQLRAIRALRGWSQEKLAKKIGITFQKIQKYENGTNRISAGRLYRLAEVLEVSVLDFYAGLDNVHEAGEILHLTKREIAWLDILKSLSSHNLEQKLYELSLAIAESLKPTSQDG